MRLELVTNLFDLEFTLLFEFVESFGHSVVNNVVFRFHDRFVPLWWKLRNPGQRLILIFRLMLFVHSRRSCRSLKPFMKCANLLNVNFAGTMSILWVVRIPDLFIEQRLIHGLCNYARNLSLLFQLFHSFFLLNLLLHLLLVLYPLHILIILYRTGLNQTTYW